MKIGIVGWGLEAQSAFRFFGPEHDYLIVNESKQSDFPAESDRIKVQFVDQAAPVGIGGQVADLSYLSGIENCDKIVFQPTAYFNLKKAFPDDHNFWQKATTAYDIFYEHAPTRNIIGVTGTKGKGTTSTLIAKMLQATGKTVHLGGNIGTPILDMLPQIKPGDWLVWELANFQLKAAHYSPPIGVCLMIAPEHLDWHPNIEDYIDAKANLFRWQKKDDVAIYMAGNHYSEQIASYSPAELKVPYLASPGAKVLPEGVIVIGDSPEVQIVKTSELKLIGRHNWQNVCAAITTVWRISQNIDAIRSVLTTFTGLEHRLEFVSKIDDVAYYDDSFGTNPDTAIVALQAFTQPVVLIVGGHDKGLPFDNLVEEIASHDRVRHVITIGQVGPQIAQQLRQHHFDSITENLANMSEVVAAARAQAQPGDVVLLSCGTSSFGMFADYKDRGNQFKKAVLDL